MNNVLDFKRPKVEVVEEEEQLEIPFDDLPEDLPLWKCTCGSFLYYISLSGTFCAGCGKQHHF